MKRGRIVNLVAMLLILLLGFSAVSAANGGRRELSGNAGYRLPRFFHYQQKLLNLSEAQKKGIEEIRKVFLEERKQILKELQILNDVLKETAFSDETEEELVEIKEEITTLQEELLDLKLEYWQKLKILLTPEQLEKLLQSERNPGFKQGKRWQGRPIKTR